MPLLSEDILSWISPPDDTVDFDEIPRFLSDPCCMTLCYRSTFRFVKEKLLDIIERGIDGDIVLVGVWRGGLAVYVQALLVEYGESHRKLYLVDTFQGFLPVDDAHPKDKKMFEYFSTLPREPGSAKNVLSCLDDWGLVRDNIRFLVGDVRETTRGFCDAISLLLVDVDFYKPTKDALNNLHHMVVQGGCVYVDDYGIEEFECGDAVDSFISENSLGVRPNKVNKFAISWDK